MEYVNMNEDAVNMYEPGRRAIDDATGAKIAASDTSDVKYKDAKAVDVNKDAAVKYYDEPEDEAGQKDQTAPVQNAAPAATFPTKSETMQQKWAQGSDANGDWVNQNGSKVLTNKSPTGGTVMYFGRKEGLADAQKAMYNNAEAATRQQEADAENDKRAPEGFDRNVEVGNLRSLNARSNRLRAQNAAKNDIIVTNGAASIDIPKGESMGALSPEGVSAVNKSLEASGASYRVNGIQKVVDGKGQASFYVYTVDRNGNRHVHHRTSGQMYDVNLAAERNLAAANGSPYERTLDKNGNPTGDIDGAELRTIGRFGDVRGRQAAWNQRNADAIARREATKQKLDMLKTNSDREFRLGLYKMLNDGPNGGRNMSKGDFFKSVLGNKSMTDMFKRGDPVMVKDPKTGEMVQDVDLDGNPKFTELTAEQAAQRMNKYYEDNFRNGAHVDPNMSADDAYRSELGRILGVDAGIQSAGAATPAPKVSATNADATKADNPARSVAMSETAKKAADGSSEADLAAEIARRKQAAADPSENNSASTAAPAAAANPAPISTPAPSNVIRPRIATARTAPVRAVNQPTVQRSTGVETLDAANSNESRLNAIENENVKSFTKSGGVHEISDDGSTDTYRISNWDYLPDEDKAKWPESTHEFREWHKFAQAKANKLKAEFDKRRKAERARIMEEEQKKHPNSRNIRDSNVEERMNKWEQKNNPESIRERNERNTYGLIANVVI